MAKHKHSYERNPYRIEGIIERSKIIKGKVDQGKTFVDTETGEVVDIRVTSADKSTTELHDEKSYAKLFLDSWELLMKISDAGRMVFVYVISQLKVNRDTVFLNADDAVLRCRISKATFYRVIDELILVKILARKTGSYLEFWINPNVLYNGNRVKLFNHYKLNVHANNTPEEDSDSVTSSKLT